MLLIVVVVRMSPHRIVQMIWARSSVTVCRVLARCGLLLVTRGEVRREARALSSFAAYIAALDQQQTAAAMYAE